MLAKFVLDGKIVIYRVSEIVFSDTSVGLFSNHALLIEVPFSKMIQIKE